MKLLRMGPIGAERPAVLIGPEPGDLINAGTPSGIDKGMNVPAYLRAGDIVQLSINGSGTQRQHMIPTTEIAR